MATPNPSRQVLQKKDLMKILGYSLTQLEWLITQGVIPEPFTLGPNCKKQYWFADVIDEWLEKAATRSAEEAKTTRAEKEAAKAAKAARAKKYDEKQAVPQRSPEEEARQ